MPGPATLPDDSVIFAVLKLCIDERGEDYIYVRPSNDTDVEARACVYVDDGKPSCLFGLMFSKLGYFTEQIKEYEGDGAAYVFWNLVHGVAGLHVERAKWLDSPMGKAIAAIQHSQDEGYTWGNAYERGMNVYKEYSNG